MWDIKEEVAGRMSPESFGNLVQVAENQKEAMAQLHGNINLSYDKGVFEN